MNMSQILSISRSGLNAYQREMDVVSNNLANVDTLGYKDKRTAFQELLNNGTNTNEVGLSQNAGLNVQQVNENLSQGVFKSTAGTYDLAIDGEGYFGVRDGADNLYLTRDGSFRRDVDGNLVTSKGMKVEVQSDVPSSQWPKDGEVSISTSGYVSIGNVRVGRILLFCPQNSIDMNDIGDNLYRCDGNLISSVHMIFEDFSKMTGNVLSTQLRMNLSVDLAAIEQISYDEFMHSIPRVTLLGMSHSEPLKGSQLLEINPSYAA